MSPNRFALAGCVVLCAWAVQAGNYNFAYRSSGELELRPLQVFDDGKDTWFQFRNSLAAPAIFAEIGGTSRLIGARRSGVFLVLPVISNRYALHFGQLEAAVAYTGAARATTAAWQEPAAVPVPPAPNSSLKPYVAPLTSYGAARPVAGDAERLEYTERDALIAFPRGSSMLGRDAARLLRSALLGSGPVARVLITGRDDGLYAEGLAHARALAIRDEVLAAGIPLAKIVLREAPGRDAEAALSHSDISVAWRTLLESSPAPVRATAPAIFAAQTPPAPISAPAPAAAAVDVLAARAADSANPQAGRFQLKKSEPVHEALKSWADSAGWELIWSPGVSWKVVRDTDFSSRDGVVAAISEVVDILREEGKPVRLKISEGNKVMEVLSSEVRHE